MVLISSATVPMERSSARSLMMAAYSMALAEVGVTRMISARYEGLESS